jgi:hypothetical protein
MSLQRFSMVALSISIVMMMESPLLRRQRSGGSQFEAKMGKKLMRPPSQQRSWAWWWAPVVPIMGGIGRRIAV